MKKILIFFSPFLMFIISAFMGGDDKFTLKEKVEQNKVVKVFYSVREIVDENDERARKASGSTEKTPIRSLIPTEYASQEIKDSILNILNRGLEVGKVFVEGDIASLPESKDAKTQYRDLSKLGDGFYVLIDVAGEYTRSIQKKVVDGNTLLEAWSGMEINAHMSFYDVTKGGVDKYGDMFTKSTLLGNAKFPKIKTEKLENIEFMEKNFPALSLLQEYKQTTFSMINKFTENQLKKHNKAVSKRK